MASHLDRFATALAALVAIAGTAHAGDSEPKIAIVIAVDAGLPSGELATVTTAFAEALGGTMHVVASAEPSADLSATCIAETECMAALCDKLNVDQLMLLAVVGLGDEIRVEPVWFGKASNVSRSRPTIVLPPSRASWRRTVASRADELLPSARRREVAVTNGTADASSAGPGGLFYASAATSVAFGAVGIYFALEAVSRNDDIDSECGAGACSAARLDELRESRDSAALWADVGGVISLASGTVALYLLVTRDRGGDSQISVSPAPGGGFASMSGRF